MPPATHGDPPPAPPNAGDQTGHAPVDEADLMDLELVTNEDGGLQLGPHYIPPPPPPALTFDNDRPRLIITHIENDNFKSYAGKQTLGPFHKSFTSIIGPNGSGKSNVIDSMLFVFGYRAQQIRSKKISVLIHNSENHQNVQSSTVRKEGRKDTQGPTFNAGLFAEYHNMGWISILGGQRERAGF